MLSDAATQELVTLPNRAERQLNEVLTRLRPEQISAMEGQINAWGDDMGQTRTDFFASNWQTGSDWREFAGGVFEPLYEACEGRHPNAVEYAGWMYGWLVRRVMIERPDEWLMYKNPEAGTEELPRNMWGTFYWRAHRAN